MNQTTIDQIPAEYLELVKSIEARAQYLAKYMLGSDIMIAQFYKDRLRHDQNDWIIEFSNAYQGTHHGWVFILGRDHIEHLDRMVEHSCQKILLHRSKDAVSKCEIKLENQ